ncbi:MAG: DUF3160 domain-containing protein [Deltaproteobacteria bacterium]|nr:DUF3160 domain-containing protein [Deltaproteobacteria bacterium]
MRKPKQNPREVALLTLALTFSCVADTNTNWLTEVKPDNGNYKACALTEKSPFARYRATQISYSPNLPEDSLPADPSEIENLERDIVNNFEFDFSEAAAARLFEHGLVLLPANRFVSRFDEAYAALEVAERPIVVSLDSTLHFAHLVFQQVIKSVEARELVPALSALLPAIARTLASIYKTQEGDLREAALRDLAFIGVALKLLRSSDFEIPPLVADQVEREVTKIESAGEALERGRDLSSIFNHDCDRDLACGGGDLDHAEYQKGRACYCEDYREYEPRAHYTETDELTRYFRASSYLSRTSLRLKSPMETRMAALLVAALNKTKITYRGEKIQAAFLWDSIYRTVSFFTGAADSLTFIEYDQQLREVFGDDFTISKLSDADDLSALIKGLRQTQESKRDTGFARAWLEDEEGAIGLSFLGRRFPFDAYALSRLLGRHIGPNPNHAQYQLVLENLSSECRRSVDDDEITDNFERCEGQSAADHEYLCCSAAELSRSEERSEIAEVCRRMPSGLDLAAVLGSDRAREHLAEQTRGYCAYDGNLDSLRQEVSRFTDQDWYETLYSTSSLALKPLFDKDLSGFPPWMTTQLYRDRCLNAGLSSWAELRHDTFHYIRQSYGPGLITAPPPSDLYWLEPLPEVYAALGDLGKVIRDGLREMTWWSDQLSEPVNRFIDLSDMLTEIAVKELEAGELTRDEKITIASLSKELMLIVDTLALVTGEKAERPPDDPTLVEKIEVQGEPYKTTVIADVYRDSTLDNTLYAGSGPIDWMVVLRRIDAQTLVAMIGPVFRYHEFVRPAAQRLDDRQWIEMLNSDDAPARPDFVAELYR